MTTLEDGGAEHVRGVSPEGDRDYCEMAVIDMRIHKPLE